MCADKSNSSSVADLEEKVLYVNRCSKVVKGGRRFSFSALVAVGDGGGSVGVGFAKANEVADAIRKAGEAARKQMKRYLLCDGTIPHEVLSVWSGVKLLLKPAGDGTGIIAGSHVRAILEVCGVRNVVAKNLGSNNPCNQAWAVLQALSQLKSKESVLSNRFG